MALEKLTNHTAKDAHAEAKYLCDKVLPGMLEVRKWADELEQVVADDYWPLPSYMEMCFIK